MSLGGILLSGVWAAAVGVAAEVPEAPAATAARPLALPGPTSPPPVPMTAEDLQAFRTYRREHLQVRRLTEYVGLSTVYETHWHHSWGGWGWGEVHAAPPRFVRHDSWTLFRGPEQLDMLTYLGVIGQEDARRKLARAVRGQRTASTVLIALGIAGTATTFVSLVGMDTAPTLTEFKRWRLVSGGGLFTMVFGFVGGSFPAARARRLLWSPAETRTLETVEDEVDSWNESLRVELGLSPEQALQAESPGPR